MQLWVQPHDESPHICVSLEQDKHQQQEVQHAGSCRAQKKHIMYYAFFCSGIRSALYNSCPFLLSIELEELYYVLHLHAFLWGGGGGGGGVGFVLYNSCPYLFNIKELYHL